MALLPLWTTAMGTCAAGQALKRLACTSGGLARSIKPSTTRIMAEQRRQYSACAASSLLLNARSPTATPRYKPTSLLAMLPSRGFAKTAIESSDKQQQQPRQEQKSEPGKTAADTASPAPTSPPGKELSEEILNLPNVLTLSRIVSVPFLGYLILHDRLPEALVLLFVAGCTDLLDGWLARKWNSYTVFGSIADPAADKLLMTVMVATLGWKNLLPAPLAALILLRDVGLVLLAFRIRYTSLPPPMTLKRYFNPQLPSAQVQPTQISKYNTFLQLLSVGGATLNAALMHEVSGAAGSEWAGMLYWPLMAVYLTTATTTVVSGWGYFVGGAGYKNVAGNSKLAERIGQRLRRAREEAEERLRRGRK